MKIKFYYKNYHSPANELRGEVFKMVYFGQLFGAPEEITAGYQNYILSALRSDFNENRFGACDHVLSEVERIERGEIDEYMYEGQGFMHIIRREGVTFEHMIFGVCPEWPLWTCPLPHYKAVLEGFREFVKMPESINSELIIELPKVNEKVPAD
jgi:hypothetical protein